MPGGEGQGGLDDVRAEKMTFTQVLGEFRAEMGREESRPRGSKLRGVDGLLVRGDFHGGHSF